MNKYRLGNNLINFFRLLIKLLESEIEIIQKIIVFIGHIFLRGSQYYVYNPNQNKPRYIHYSFDSALTEAKRIAGLEPEGTNIEILEIVHKVPTNDIPF